MLDLKNYILDDDKNIVEMKDTQAWSTWMKEKGLSGRLICSEQLYAKDEGEVFVVTSFTGQDMFDEGETPKPFETRINDEWKDNRYYGVAFKSATYQEAQETHDRICDSLRYGESMKGAPPDREPIRNRWEILDL